MQIKFTLEDYGEWTVSSKIDAPAVNLYIPKKFSLVGLADLGTVYFSIREHGVYAIAEIVPESREIMIYLPDNKPFAPSRTLTTEILSVYFDEENETEAKILVVDVTNDSVVFDILNHESKIFFSSRPFWYPKNPGGEMLCIYVGNNGKEFPFRIPEDIDRMTSVLAFRNAAEKFCSVKNLSDDAIKIGYSAFCSINKVTATASSGLVAAIRGSLKNLSSPETKFERIKNVYSSSTENRKKEKKSFSGLESVSLSEILSGVVSKEKDTVRVIIDQPLEFEVPPVEFLYSTKSNKFFFLIENKDMSTDEKLAIEETIKETTGIETCVIVSLGRK